MRLAVHPVVTDGASRARSRFRTMPATAGFRAPSASISTEKGIISPWPKDGPKILWHKEVGAGYGMHGADAREYLEGVLATGELGVDDGR